MDVFVRMPEVKPVTAIGGLEMFCLFYEFSGCGALVLARRYNSWLIRQELVVKVTIAICGKLVTI